jgi:hypothetical protein
MAVHLAKKATGYAVRPGELWNGVPLISWMEFCW